MSEPQIPLTRPWMGDHELEGVGRVLESGWLTQGPRTTEFEAAVAESIGVRHAVATNSCTTALDVLLRCLGVGPGDEVIVPSFSFIATANVVLMQGATPVFGDIDLASYNLDPAAAAALVTERTKVIMPVDQMGMPCDLGRFREIAEQHGLHLVQDAACALGSVHGGKAVGAEADAACLSFHPRKLVTTGEGGMVVTNDDALAQQVRTIVSHGASVDEEAKHKSKKATRIDYAVLGTNYRLSDVQGAIGVAQMARLGEMVELRNRWAALYGELLAPEPRLVTPRAPEGSRSNFQSYCVRIEGATAESRDAIVTRLRSSGVQSTPGIPSSHRYTLYRQMNPDLSLPNSELASDTTVILPLFPQMREEDVETSARTLLEAVRELG